jgi:hypothetical protein
VTAGTDLNPSGSRRHLRLQLPLCPVVPPFCTRTPAASDVIGNVVDQPARQIRLEVRFQVGIPMFAFGHQASTVRELRGAYGYFSCLVGRQYFACIGLPVAQAACQYLIQVAKGS